ncbi:MAG: DUF4178 domain-containing protein [Nannocystaceae bacterium]
MLTIASLLAAMTIAGAFWVGILAARRLRDWGDGRNVLGEGEDGQPLALTAGPGLNRRGSIPHDAASHRIRARVAQRISGRSFSGDERRALPATADAPDLDLTGLRQGDVVSIDSQDPARDGDALVEGVINLREGAQTTVVVVLNDASRRRWLVGSPGDESWFLLDPVSGHGLSGEPPRHIARGPRTYALQRRGQASASGVGMHGRPALPRVATYLYSVDSINVLWLERWGEQVLMGEGVPLPAHFVSLLPGNG